MEWEKEGASGSEGKLKSSGIELAETNNTDALRRTELKPSRTSMNWSEMMEHRKTRIKSEPTNPPNFKQEIIRRV